MRVTMLANANASPCCFRQRSFKATRTAEELGLHSRRPPATRLSAIGALLVGHRGPEVDFGGLSQSAEPGSRHRTTMQSPENGRDDRMAL